MSHAMVKDNSLKQCVPAKKGKLTKVKKLVKEKKCQRVLQVGGENKITALIAACQGGKVIVTYTVPLQPLPVLLHFLRY
jgi:hypothetical protein